MYFYRFGVWEHHLRMGRFRKLNAADANNPAQYRIRVGYVKPKPMGCRRFFRRGRRLIQKEGFKNRYLLHNFNAYRINKVTIRLSAIIYCPE